MAKSKAQYRLVAQNRKARYHFTILETMEAGMILTGSEVKSLREGQGNIAESYISVDKTENCVTLINASIPKLATARYFGHEERQPRVLLLHYKEIRKLREALLKKGNTAVPLEMYFNNRGIVKIKLAIAQGKKTVDKRDDIKKRDWQRQKARLLKQTS